MSAWAGCASWKGSELEADFRICPTCPYKWIITQQISMRTHLERKQVDDVLGGEDAWKNVDQTDGELHSADGKADDQRIARSARSVTERTSDRCRFVLPTSL